MGLSRRLRRLDDSYLASVDRAREKSKAFDHATGLAEGLFTPRGQLRYVIPIGLAANAAMVLLGILLFIDGATVGLVLAVGSMVLGVLMLLARRLQKRRLSESPNST